MASVGDTAIFRAILEGIKKLREFALSLSTTILISKTD